MILLFEIILRISGHSSFVPSRWVRMIRTPCTCALLPNR